MTRSEALDQAVRFGAPLPSLTANLGPFPAGHGSPQATIRKRDVVAVLERFIEGELTSKDVCGWAELLETRDDVDVEDSTDEIVATVFFWLANPTINFPNGRLEVDHARSLRDRIQAAAV